MLRDLGAFSFADKFVKDFVEVSRSVQVASIKRIAIVLDDFLDTIDSRVEDIAIKREAVRSFLVVWVDLASKAIQVDHFVGVVELENVSHVLYNWQVGVILGVQTVKRVIPCAWSIRKGEIYGYAEVDFATSEHVFQERMLAFNHQLG